MNLDTVPRPPGAVPSTHADRMRLRLCNEKVSVPRLPAWAEYQQQQREKSIVIQGALTRALEEYAAYPLLAARLGLRPHVGTFICVYRGPLQQRMQELKALELGC